MTEQWRPIPGWRGIYEVSDGGQVRGVDRVIRVGTSRTCRIAGRVHTTKLDSNGRPLARLRLGGKITYAHVHRLVLEAFVGPAPDGMECCHWDGDPTNNRLSNLRWDTKSANQRDKVRHGTHPCSKKTHCPNGHPYSGENLDAYIRPGGAAQRRCRTCHRVRALAAYHRKAANRREEAKRATAEAVRKAKERGGRA